MVEEVVESRWLVVVDVDVTGRPVGCDILVELIAQLSVDGVAVVLLFGILKETCLSHIVAREIVGESLVATSEAEVVLLRGGYILKVEVVPVGIAKRVLVLHPLVRVVVCHCAILQLAVHKVAYAL